MLVSFSVENYKSFSEKQTLLMSAGSSARKNARYSFPTFNSFAPDVLRSSCIFGANGAGKSSFVEAIDFFKGFVISSAKDMQEGEEIEVSPHLFRKDLKASPSAFEIIFIHKGTLYQYGFSVDSKRVHDEWLFSRPNSENSKMRDLFRRRYTGKEEDQDPYKWKFNSTFLRGQKELWKNSTRSNALFLSQAVQLNAVDLKDVFEWVQKYLRVIESPESLALGYTVRQCVEEGWKDKILDLLKSVDIRIADLDIQTRDITPTDLPDDLPKTMRDALLEKIKSGKSKAFEVNTIHKTREGEIIPLSLEDESDGTNVLFRLAGPWFDVLENGYTLIVDELHNSLHPHALKTLIELFHNPKINKKGAQLIFTSHETSVMTKGFMHQDQVWLVEKGDEENTHLIPLSDFKVRDLAAFQKAYLNGRYGGVPKLRECVDGE